MKKLQSYAVAITNDSKSNLCDTCAKCVADCKSNIIGFGNGTGGDNVIMCLSYTGKSGNDIAIGEIHIR